MSDDVIGAGAWHYTATFVPGASLIPEPDWDAGKRQQAATDELAAFGAWQAREKPRVLAHWKLAVRARYLTKELSKDAFEAVRLDFATMGANLHTGTADGKTYFRTLLEPAHPPNAQGGATVGDLGQVDLAMRAAIAQFETRKLEAKEPGATFFTPGWCSVNGASPYCTPGTDEHDLLYKPEMTARGFKIDGGGHKVALALGALAIAGGGVYYYRAQVSRAYEHAAGWLRRKVGL